MDSRYKRTSVPTLTLSLPERARRPGSRPATRDDETLTGRPLSVPPEAAVPYLMVLCGQSIGRVFEIRERSIVLGRGEDADITLADTGLSRKHAKFIRCSNGVVAIRDLSSKNGTFVNGHKVRARSLNDADKIHIGTETVLKFGYRDSLEHQFQERLYAEATRDRLTGLYNRQFFREALSRDISAARRHPDPLSLILLDIDRFKQINDDYGHGQGDQVLMRLGQLLSSLVRAEETVGRLGGEEFGVIVRSTTFGDARLLAERMRAAVEANIPRDPEGREPLTISLGVGTFVPSRHPGVDSFLECVDQLLYVAKRSGRNRVEGLPPLVGM